MGSQLDAEVDTVIRKLEEARAVSEWHYRDAVEELLLVKQREEEDYEF